MKKTIFMIMSAVMLFLLASCNWDVLSNKVSEISGGDYTSTSFDIFTGDAPRNLVASKAASTTDIGLSFSPVKGADYYLVYRADIPREYDDSEIDPDSLKWARIGRVEPVSSADNRKLSIVDSITDDFESSNGDGKDFTKFLYRVQAGSVYTDTYYPIEGKMSDIVIGYTLAPPSGMTSSAGDFEDRIELTWQQSDGAQSYDLYYTDDVTKDNIDDWNLIARNIPYNAQSDTIGYTFRPAENEKGKILYFTTLSVGRSGRSDRSSYSSGYTFVAGAPEEPENVQVSMYEYPDRISISWDKFDVEDKTDDQGRSYEYEWTILRTDDKGGDEIQVLNFKSADFASVPGLVFDESAKKYIYSDTSNIEPYVVYTYTIYASCLVDTAEGLVLTPGKSKTDITGAVIAPSKDNNLTVDFDTDVFTLTLGTPEGFTAEKGWEYVIQGRMNNELQSYSGNWEELARMDVSENSVYEYTYEEGVSACNEFRVAIANREGYVSVYTDTITASNKHSAPVFNVTRNYYSSSFDTADTNLNHGGIYPVLLKIDDQDYQGYEVQANYNGLEIGSFIDFASAFENADLNLSEKDLAPERVFEQYEYRVRGVDKYGSYTQWSDVQVGYGALTPDKFIKTFEAFSLKPWEFVNNEEIATYYPNLISKWLASEIYNKIIQKGTGSLTDSNLLGGKEKFIYENTDYHGGTIGYSSYASGLSGEISFVYKNAGETEGILSNGRYNMHSVNSSGNGNSVDGTVSVEGMYPATVYFNSLVVRDYAFSGNYNVVLKYDGEEVTTDVAATTNDF